MSQLPKLAAAVALVALGGAAGFALNGNRSTASTAAQKPPPVEVRTQVIRHTVRIHRKPKPVKQPPARPASPPPAASAPQVVAAAPPQPVAAPQPVAPVRTRPVRTRTSGAGGHGGEHEHESEHEGSDD